jgi:hypothetical protein
VLFRSNTLERAFSRVWYGPPAVSPHAATRFEGAAPSHRDRLPGTYYFFSTIAATPL